MCWCDGSVTRGRYWTPFRPADSSDLPHDETELSERLWTLVSDSVRQRLVADVPLGAFLSGGIDSSTVVAAMAEHLPPSAIRTFSIGFDSPSFDESEHARAVARHLGTRHTEEVLTSDTVLDLLPGILSGMSEPLADGSLVPTFLLSRFARRSVTVALSGDGADELLLGYPTFHAHRAARIGALVPRALRQGLLKPLAARLPVSTDNISVDFRVKRFLAGLDYPALKRHFVWIGGVDPHEQSNLLRRLYLSDVILVKVDRASMAHGLEVRSPFLDHRLVEFLVALPSNMKLHRLTTKFLLRRTMRTRLPEETLRRAKKGFGMPIAEWLKGPLRGLAEDLLSESALLDDHVSGRTDNRKPLWSLLAFQLWRRRYLG